MEEQTSKGMWLRYGLFIAFSLGVLALNTFLMSVLHPNRGEKQPAVEQVAERPNPPEPKPAQALQAEKTKPSEKPAAPLAEKPRTKPELAETQVADSWLTLGSADPASPYRMLVTFTNRGAAIRRIELNHHRFRDLEDRRGYLGQVIGSEGAAGSGVVVQVVGPGTPAAEAGVKVGDIIQAVGPKQVSAALGLEDVLDGTKPGQVVTLTLLRDGQKLEIPATLSRRPLEIIRPEAEAPPSFLMTLTQIDDLALEPAAEPKAGEAPAPPQPDRELEGAKLRGVNWEVESRDETHVTFLRKLPQWDLEVRKTFRLATLPEEEQSNDVYPAYHLVYRIEIRNRGTASRRVIYRLEGPNGLPTEGWWYASKVSRNWGGAGLRDVIVAFNGQDPLTLSASGIAQDQYPTPLRRDDPMHFVGVDAQYFSAVLLRENADEKWTSEWQPIHYGEVPKDRLMLSNTSFRVTSVQREVPPGGALEENFQIFAGPRKPALLAEYGLNEIVYYGWFKWAAIPMLWILHGFYYVIPNYGIAIILLTVLVRGAMYPLSHKQALSAQKMQEIQPELKRLQEKYKNNLEARGKAQQELFKKHNYNPMGGCLIVFLQLPIFVGLYRALMVDVELRQAPLITESIRWASNLASPDMLFDWSGFMPEFITRGTGMFGLGPYFNLLPIFAIVLFLWQQKKFMPPPADEQAALQQKMMQYMMVFMGILFFKVASGLCLYFIASSLWSIAERQYLPKTHPASNAPAAGTNPPPRETPGRGSAGRDGSGPRKRKTPRK